VGELDLIRQIRGRLGGPGRGTVVGLGDDAAVFEPPKGLELFTCDAFVEGVHFRRDFSSLQEIGAKCMVANVSDVAAMGGFPTRATVALCIPEAASDREVDELYDGMIEVAARYSFEIVGGDVVSSREGLVISIALLGAAEAGRIVTRSGAVVGDAVLATGSFGASEAGLASLLKGLPRSAAVDAARERHTSPRARLKEAQAIIEVATPHAMIDVSDGLSTDVWHVAEESGVGIRLERDAVPIAPAAQEIGHQIGRDPLELALASGEEFELVAAIPPSELSRTVDHVEAVAGTEVTRIGEVVEAERGCTLVMGDGTEMPLERRGYEHLSGDER
jgi:thiamine-monophosphate kinase